MFKSVRTRFVKNIGAQFVASFARIGSGALISFIVARYWGADAYGEYAAIIAFVMVFKFAVDWGLHRMIIREVAINKEKVNSYMSTGLLLITGMSVIAIAGILIVSQISGNSDRDLLLIFLASLWLVFGTIGLFFSGVYYAFEKMELDTLTVLAEIGTLVILMVILLPKYPESTLILLVIALVARIVNVLISAGAYLIAIGRFGHPVNLKNTRLIILTTIPFGLTILFLNLSNVPTVLLSRFHGNEVTGFFTIALLLAMLPRALATMTGNSLYPILSRASEGRKHRTINLLEVSTHYMLALGLFFAVVEFILADRILTTIYGPSYEASATYMRIISLSVPFIFVNTALATSITSAGRQKQRTVVVVAGGLTAVVLGFLLIPKFGAIGASVILVVVGLLRYLLFTRLSIKMTGRVHYFGQVGPILLSLLLLTLFLLLFHDGPLFIVLIAASLLYALMIVAFDGAIRRDVLSFWRAMNSRERKQSVQQVAASAESLGSNNVTGDGA